MPRTHDDHVATSPLIASILHALDEAYDHKAWHGPNLRGSIRRVEADTACWRPTTARHSIAEHVLHAAYWKYAVRRLLAGEKRGSFARKGSNWFVVDGLSPEQWRECIRLLDAEHRALRTAVLAIEPGGLSEVPAGSKHPRLRLIHGIALHDVYHAGQIQLLKRLHGEV